MEQNNYINYNNNQIDQNAFMEYAASGIDSYLKGKSWTNKRKQLFLDAYQDIMSRGVLGASPEDGLWKVSHKGDQIDLNSMSKKQQEMYKEAAYYIKKSMEEVYSPKEESSKDKETSTKSTYSAQEHINNFNRFLSNNMFGGNSINIEDWNNLDVIGSDGNRETTKRAAKLADLLQSYSDNLKDGDYDFTDSPYSDINDLKTRIGEAITQLRNGTWDREDKNALNRIGLDWRNYFDTTGLKKADNEQQGTAQSSEEPIISSNQDVTFGKLRRLKGVHAREASSFPDDYNATLADTFGVGEEGFNKFNEQLQLLLEKGSVTGLTGKESKDLGNLIHFIRQNNPNYQKSNITDSDWNELSKSSYKKLLQDAKKEDFIRLPYKTSNSQYVYADKQGNVYYLTTKGNKELSPVKFEKSDKYNKYKSNFLKNTNSNAAKQAYLNNKPEGFTSAEWQELSGIALDVASIINPEPISASVMATGAAGLRHAAKLQQPGSWGIGDWVGQGLDYASGLLGAVPIIGDAVLAGKTLRGLRGFLKGLDKAGKLGILFNLGQGSVGTTQALIKKVIDGEDLTVQDWRNIGNLLMGVAGYRNVRRANTARSEVLQKRGFELEKNKNFADRFWKNPKVKTQDKLLANVDGKNVELTVTKSQKEKLTKNLNKAGNNEEKLNKVVDDFKGELSKNNSIIKENSSITLQNTEGTWRNARLNRFIRTPNFIRTQNQHFNQTAIGRNPENDVFDSFLNDLKNKSRSGRMKASYYQGIDKINKATGLYGEQINPQTQQVINNSKNQQIINSPLRNNRNNENILDIRRFPQQQQSRQGRRLEYKWKQQQKAQKEINLFTKSYGERGKSGLESFQGGYGSNKIKPGTYTFDLGNGNKITFEVPKNESLASVRNRIQNQIKEMVLGKTDVVTSANILRKLKKVGALKQGGNVNTIIYNFLKEKQ